MWSDSGTSGWFGMGAGHMWWFWLLVVIVLVVLVRLLAGPSGVAGHGKSARELLDERYARGEIDQAEYEEKKRQLMK